MTWRPLRRTATRARPAALGYTSVPGDGASAATDGDAQRRAIGEASERLGLDLLDVLDDREPETGGPRPGLTDALGRIEAGDASCLVCRPDWSA